MKSNLSGALCASLFSLSLVSTADAALTDWGARAGSSIADCPSFCTNFNFGPTVGGVNVVDSGTSSVSDSRGSASASASLTGGFSTPVLRAEAYANPAFHGAFASAFAVQGYTYNGAGETLTLDVSLDGLVTDPETDPSDTRASMEIVLYESAPFAFISDRGTLDFEVGATPLSQPDGSEASVVLQLDFTNPTNDSGQLSVDVATGDEFYLWAFLRAVAQSGSEATSADAFNTGTMSFAGNPDLTAAGTTVIPLPAAFWLFSGSLLGLFGVVRRRAA